MHYISFASYERFFSCLALTLILSPSWFLLQEVSDEDYSVENLIVYDLEGMPSLHYKVVLSFYNDKGKIEVYKKV